MAPSFCKFDRFGSVDCIGRLLLSRQMSAVLIDCDNQRLQVEFVLSLRIPNSQCCSKFVVAPRLFHVSPRNLVQTLPKSCWFGSSSLDAVCPTTMRTCDMQPVSFCSLQPSNAGCSRSGPHHNGQMETSMFLASTHLNLLRDSLWTANLIPAFHSAWISVEVHVHRPSK